jgi:hypothetical protein
MNLEDKVLKYIKDHPKGVTIQDMEIPLGEKRMKLGFVMNKLIDEGKVQKIEKMYFQTENYNTNTNSEH